MPDDDTDYTTDALAASEARRPLPPVQPRVPGTPPSFLMASGVIVLVVATVISLGGGFFSVLGAIIGVFGAVLTSIGVIAAGVRLGMEWTDYDRRTRER